MNNAENTSTKYVIAANVAVDPAAICAVLDFAAFASESLLSKAKSLA